MTLMGLHMTSASRRQAPEVLLSISFALKSEGAGNTGRRCAAAKLLS